MKHRGIKYPEPLKKGDKIALISPASAVKKEYVDGATERLKERGYEPVLMPHALDHVDGSFASSRKERLSDLLQAIENPEFKAIFCTRGGYGCCQLLMDLSPEFISRHPKWIIGFSDISALHALWYHSGVASIHGPMAKHLATMPEDDPCTLALFDILENGCRFDYTVSPHANNRHGFAKGVLRGGNLAVLNDLSATPYDILDIKTDEDVILFLEDISEPIYKVNRMLWRLLNSDSLQRVKGIIFGRFTEYKPDANFSSMEDMIHHFVKASIPDDIPIVYKFPTGHTDINFPLVEGAEVDLEADDLRVRLRTV